MDTFIDIGCLEYHSDQRLEFGEGTLRQQWFAQFPQLFDLEDFTRASNRTRPYFFYEWLAAIVLHQSTGFLALVTRYQTDMRKRSLLPSILPSTVLSVLDNRSRWGKTQGPDLLMYAQIFQDGFFVSVRAQETPCPQGSVVILTSWWVYRNKQSECCGSNRSNLQAHQRR
jgi:hypothetical protein